MGVCKESGCQAHVRPDNVHQATNRETISVMSTAPVQPVSLPPTTAATARGDDMPLHAVDQHRTYFQRYGRIVMRVLLLCLLIGVSSCNGDEASNPAARDRAALLSNVAMLNVDMYDSYYGAEDTNLTEPPVWTVQTGADVVVNIVNHGELNHNWAVVKKGITVPVPYEEGQAGDLILHGVGMVYNNSQTTITFVAPESGEYQVICTVSGHYPFMQGKLRIVEGD